MHIMKSLSDLLKEKDHDVTSWRDDAGKEIASI